VTKVNSFEFARGLEQKRGSVAARLDENAIWARRRSTLARWRLLFAPAAAMPRSARASSRAPASYCVRTAASERCARRDGSDVSPTARSWNAAAAVSPPHAWARPAARSSSAATSSSGPATASARCQARRSGSICMSVVFAGARCTRRRSAGAAARYTAERERMAKPHPAVDLSQPGQLRRLERQAGDPESPRCARR
jgi:hypothetical protein